MYSKSSTFLALSSILAILAVLSIAITDMEGGSIRKPFANSEKDTSSEGQISLPKGWDSLIGENNSGEISKVEVSTIDTGLVNEKAPSENPVGVSSTSSAVPTTDNGSNTVVEGPVVVKNTAPTAPIAPSNSTDLLVKNVNDESLRMAGYTDFVIKPKPFDGKLFDLFDISMLGPMDVIEKIVTESRNGNEANVLTVYEFGAKEKGATQEIYDYLKAKIKNELGITINENNQFGLSSFFINFGVPSDSAFLVVKTRSNVYALSYPKAKYGNKDYFVLVSALLKELI